MFHSKKNLDSNPLLTNIVLEYNSFICSLLIILSCSTLNCTFFSEGLKISPCVICGSCLFILCLLSQMIWNSLHIQQNNSAIQTRERSRTWKKYKQKQKSKPGKGVGGAGGPAHMCRQWLEAELREVTVKRHGAFALKPLLGISSELLPKSESTGFRNLTTRWKSCHPFRKT